MIFPSKCFSLSSRRALHYSNPVLLRIKLGCTFKEFCSINTVSLSLNCLGILSFYREYARVSLILNMFFRNLVPFLGYYLFMKCYFSYFPLGQ